jgi:hypothetical protein
MFSLFFFFDHGSQPERTRVNESSIKSVLTVTKNNVTLPDGLCKLAFVAGGDDDDVFVLENGDKGERINQWCCFFIFSDDWNMTV